MSVIERYGNRVQVNVDSESSTRCRRSENRDVAEAIGMTELVVKNYLRVIYDKLGLWNRLEFALCMNLGVVLPHINPVTLLPWVKMKAALLRRPVVASSVLQSNDIGAPTK